MPIDTALIGALHIEYLRKREVLTDEPPHHALFQTSTIDALLDGRYDGDVTVGGLKTRGDFGLGTLEALDGEMVVLDGRFYQVRADGRACELGDAAKTPFAVVTFFEPGSRCSLEGPVDLPGLYALLDRVLGDAAEVHAVRLDGRFEYVKTRSVPRQRKPYPPLAEVVKSQPTFEFRDVAGSLVGFRFPDYAQGINVPGYHLHFITGDRTGGGHLLECRVAGGELGVDHEADLCLELPAGVAIPTLDTSARKQDALNRIER